jgi:hypothetical protein
LTGERTIGTAWRAFHADASRGGRVAAAAFALLLLGSTLPSAYLADGRRNLHVLQAKAFLEGRLDIEKDDTYPWDVSTFEGRRYVAFPPGPALLLVPFVAVFGAPATNTPLIALALTALGVLLLHGILRRLAVPDRLHVWLIGGFMLGTAYWYGLARSRDVWFFSQVVAVTFVLLSLHEALGRRRAWLAGLYLGVAVISRQLTIVTGLFVAAALLEGELRERRPLVASLPMLAALAAPLAACVGLLLAYNHLRFGSPFDSGYAHMALPGFFGERARLGLFSAAFIPFNAVHLFLQGFHVEFDSPDKLTHMVPDQFGTGILAASPFVLAAIYAPHRSRLALAAWAVVALTVLAQLRYFANGWVQLNAQRYTLVYWPVMTILVALGLARRAEDGEERLWIGATLFAIGLNAFAMGLRVINPALEWYVKLFQKG